MAVKLSFWGKIENVNTVLEGCKLYKFMNNTFNFFAYSC